MACAVDDSEDTNQIVRGLGINALAGNATPARGRRSRRTASWQRHPTAGAARSNRISALSIVMPEALSFTLGDLAMTAIALPVRQPDLRAVHMLDRRAAMPSAPQAVADLSQRTAMKSGVIHVRDEGAHRFGRCVHAAVSDRRASDAAPMMRLPVGSATERYACLSQRTLSPGAGHVGSRNGRRGLSEAGRAVECVARAA